jgi:hypothetical protein
VLKGMRGVPRVYRAPFARSFASVCVQRAFLLW